MTRPRLSREQYVKYSRQVMLPQVQMEGQGKLLEAKVLLVGMGALGSPQALYLAGAGVGTIGLVDADSVDLTNLQRQVAHSAKEVGQPKVESGARAIKALNPDVDVRIHPTRLDSANTMSITADYDIIVDCTDNFPARYLLSDACTILGKPLVHGAVFQFQGQATVFHPAAGGPCYRCLFRTPPGPGEAPSCGEAGVIGVVPGIIGLIQATEVLKLIIGTGDTLMGRLLIFDTLSTKSRELKIKPNPGCPACGENPTIRELQDYELFCGITPPQPSAPETLGSAREITVVELARKLEAGSPITFLDVREEWERPIYPFPNAHPLPFSRLSAEWESLSEMKRGEIVVCCLFGWRSREACQFLRGKGFENVSNLEGGLEYWFLHQEGDSGGGG